MEGYIQLHRSLLHHWVSSDPEARSLWIEILLTASYKKHKENKRGKLVELDVGELLFSRPQWAARLDISESKIYRLLDLFTQDGMIEVSACGRQYTRVKVLNWKAYQPVGEVYPYEKSEQGNGQEQSLILQGLQQDLKQEDEQRTDNVRTSIMKEGNKGKKNKSSVKVFTDDSVEMKLASLLKNSILNNNKKARVPHNNGLQKWAADMDLMLRIDKRTELEIRQVIEFSQKDSFWMANILSARKLREKFDTLLLQSKRSAKQQPVPKQETKGNLIVATDEFRKANGY